MNIKPIITFLIAGAAAVNASAADVDYMPRVGGVIRARWDMATDNCENRFAVRNARVYVTGQLAAPVTYFVQTDFCNQGSIQFLDAWIRLNAFKGFDIQAGQFRIPFGVDPFRAPGNYIFANRSFIGRDLDNFRAVGLQVAYVTPTQLPVTIKTGVFSPHAITDHSVWSKKMTYALKAEVPVGHFKVTGGFQTMSPYGVRFNMADATINYTTGGFTAEAEYMYKHYTGDSFPNCHAYNVWADYGMPLKKSMFKRLSFQARVDGSTQHSAGKEGQLTADQPYRNRVTLGSTISAPFLRKAHLDIHLNYEKYLYHEGYDAPYGRRDCVLAEMVVVF